MNQGSLLALAASTIVVTGCTALGYRPHTFVDSHNASSLVDLLYPDGRVPAPAAEPPQLALPLRVGLAFMPSANTQGTGLDEAHKLELLERIKQRFASRKFVSEIVLVPDYYLAGHRGFSGLDGIKRLHGLDVLALVFFDQETLLDRNEWSLAYMTMLGANIVKGSRHDVSTLIDQAKVYGGCELRHGSGPGGVEECAG